MKETKISILLHPVRMRIIQTLISGKRLTVQQINELIPEVPQATMYRHLNKLLETGIIAIAEENQVRGTIEKVYCLVEHTAEQTNGELLKASKDEQLKYFFTFLINLLGRYEEYISQEKFDLIKDGVVYSQAFIYADDNEYNELIGTIDKAILRVSENRPGQGRKARNLATIVIPQGEDKQR